MGKIEDMVGEETIRDLARNAEEVEPNATTDGISPEEETLLNLLAAMTPIEYGKRRKAVAKELDATLPLLDEEIKIRRAKANEGLADNGTGSPVFMANLEQWPESVDGVELLNQLSATFARYIILPEGAATAMALSTVHTHCHEVAYVSPFLTFESPEKRCGKSTAMAVLQRLVARALPASNISPAALFRSTEAWQPTLLVDEADSFLAENDELRGVLNSGHSRATAYVIRVEGECRKSVEELLPWLYLKGISTGDFSDALAALVGADAPGLSANTIVRLKKVWQEELERWQGRDLSAKRYVYFWADGIYFQPRLDKDRQCILVIIGADDRGRKEVLAIDDGYRESAQSWRELLLDLKKRGLVIPPELATGDGALGFWKALREVYGSVREQRCWVHKTANVLNKLPKSVQPKVKKRLQDIWMAETKDEAEKAFDFFVEIFGPKYDKAVACLAKNRVELLTFYDFPAEHWKHLRTTNPIESTFATVRLRTARTKGCLSRKTALMMVFKLCQSASKKRRRLNGSQRLAEIIQGVTFKDGEKLTDRAA